MSICAQAKAARRKARQDLRWHVHTPEGGYKPKKKRSTKGHISRSAARASSRMRKRVQAGGRMGSIGFGMKK